MSQAQKKILGIVRDQIKRAGLETVDKPQWANTGAIHIEVPGAFGSKAKVVYSFQDSTFTLSIYLTKDGREVGVPSQPPRQGYFDFYMKYSEESLFAQFQRTLQETLDKVAREVGAPMGNGKYLLEFTQDCSADYRRGFLAALSFFDGGDGFQVAESFGEGQVPDAVMLLVPNQDNATYSVRGDGNVEFESTGAVI